MEPPSGCRRQALRPQFTGGGGISIVNSQGCRTCSEIVTVGIENVRSVITGIVIQARAGLAVVGRARRHCCLVERVHLGLALGDKADMRSPGVGIALPEPEEYAAVPSEALEVGVSFGGIRAVVIDGMQDAERRAVWLGYEH